MSDAVIPLLSTKDCNNDVFATFSRAFLAHHPGYGLVRPALLPLLLPRSLALRMWRTTAALLAGLRQVPERHSGDGAAWIGALGYPETEIPWLAGMTDPRSVEIATCCARADFVLGAEGPRLVEINVGPTIGGIGVLDRYTETFRTVCGKAPGISLPRPALAWARALQRFAPTARPLRVALVIAKDEAGIPHPYEAAHYLRQSGLAPEVARAEEVRFEGAHAETPGGPVDIVYGCFTFDQLREPAYRRFVDRAMACHAAGGPIYFAPPAFTLFGNKAMLGRIGNIDLVAPTRMLDATTRPHAISHRTTQVLKPAIGYGGEGVMIGADCSQAAWREAIDGAMATGRPHVLQDYVAPVAVPIPSSEGESPYHVGIGCLAFGGRFGGFLLRQTPAATHGLANCRQGATFAAAGIAEDARFAREVAARTTPALGLGVAA